MTRILVLYYWSWGQIEEIAPAVADGAALGGARVDVRRVAETALPKIVKSLHYNVDYKYPLIEGTEQLADSDGIIVGTPTRFGRMPSQMAAFWDATGGLWQKNALVGKVGAAFTSTGYQHGGQETTLFSVITNLLHHGLTIVGLDYGFKGQGGTDQVRGGAPYGATTIADSDGSRRPSQDELDAAKYLGRKVSMTAAKLAKQS